MIEIAPKINSVENSWGGMFCGVQAKIWLNLVSSRAELMYIKGY